MPEQQSQNALERWGIFDSFSASRQIAMGMICCRTDLKSKTHRYRALARLLRNVSGQRQEYGTRYRNISSQDIQDIWLQLQKQSKRGNPEFNREAQEIVKWCRRMAFANPKKIKPWCDFERAIEQEEQTMIREDLKSVSRKRKMQHPE